MELVLGIAFAACAILLLYALVNLLDEADAVSDRRVEGEPGDTSALARVARQLRWFAVFFMLPLLAAVLFVSAQDYHEARSGGFAVIVFILLIGVAAAYSAYVLARRRLPPRHKDCY